MRLYLSSFLLGDHPEHLRTLIGSDDRGAVVVANALDHVPTEARRSRVERELAALADLGLGAVELDLRDYFGQQQRLRRDLAEVSMAWLTGGNVFMLRYALSRSGADVAFGDLLATDALVYAGYSAGPCVLARSLRGLEVVDDAEEVMRTYGAEPMWDGLGLLDEAFVPHYRSPGHPESAAMEVVVARYRAEGTPYRTLHDGQALIINGPDTAVV